MKIKQVMDSKNLITAFNNHFLLFVDDIYSVFPDNVDILTAKNSLIALRKANPKLLIKIWLNYVYTPYKEQIDKGDIDFFITKDYSSDLSKNNNANKIMESIDRLRTPVKEMTPENQEKTMKHIQNLSKLALLASHQ